MYMYTLDPIMLRSAAPSRCQYTRDIRIVFAARRLYERACRRGRLSRFWRLITRRSRPLLDLTTIEAACTVHTRHYPGVQRVLIEQIRGSAGRSADFDSLFYPSQGHSQKRWVSIAAARMMAFVLPPVELIQVGDSYFVRDGHYRISVARALGEEYIEAEVTVWQVSQPLPGEQPILCVPALEIAPLPLPVGHGPAAHQPGHGPGWSNE